MSLFIELKRRNVFRVGIAYVVIAWLMAQVAELLLDTFESPDWFLKSLLVLFLVGLCEFGCNRDRHLFHHHVQT